MIKKIILIGVVALVAVFFLSQGSEDITNEGASLVSPENLATNNVKENGGYRTLGTADIVGTPRSLNFNFSILEDWKVSPVSAAGAINIYDPSAEGETTLERSQIFITYFTANNFQTLGTVNILSREEHSLADRSAVTYVITKKDGAADLTSQPSWRNVTHKVTDVRLSEENPSLFYVFAKNPKLSEAEFQRFLGALEI